MGLKIVVYLEIHLAIYCYTHKISLCQIINTGVKVLVRTDNKGAVCDFRLAQEVIQC